GRRAAPARARWSDSWAREEAGRAAGAAPPPAPGARRAPPAGWAGAGTPPAPAPPHPGVGGYFSPHSFTSTVVRVEVRGRLGRRHDYSLTAFLGGQSYTGSDRRTAGGVAAALTLRAGDRFSVPLTYVWDNY